MNVNPNVRPGGTGSAVRRLGVFDCDIHPVTNTRKELYPWLDDHWKHIIEAYGAQRRRGVQVGSAYPKSQPEAWRRDAWPANGGNAGGDLGLMQTQHLDENNIETGILNPSGGAGDLRNHGLASAYSYAVNEWQLATFVDKEPRLRAGVVIPYNQAPAAVKEIERRANDPRFYHVMFYTRTAEPLGDQRYWPIYEAAEASGFPLGIHAFGDNGYPVTGGGWPTFYLEEMFGHSPSSQGVVMSMVLNGVFERFPKLKVIMVEGGMAWVPSLTWRMDTHYKKLKSELPHLKRLPSEYVRQNIWITSQPIEEPAKREHLLETVEWLGWDRLCFSSDYPHWDFDDPMLALPLAKLTAEQRENFLRNNARTVFSGRRALEKQSAPAEAVPA
jgi:predicted TIM-barrel fold metal-dependent hydrolase